MQLEVKEDIKTGYAPLNAPSRVEYEVKGLLNFHNRNQKLSAGVETIYLSNRHALLLRCLFLTSR